MSSGSKFSQALALGSYFLSGCLAINTSQVLGAPLYLINQDWYNAWIAFTKQSFNLLTITLTQWWAPTTVKVSGDASMRGQLLQTTEGNLICNFPERLVMIANHQIYTDWLYLWWVAYCGGMSGQIYIVLKESLRRIPVIGWGIQLSQFIFLKRNWEKDKAHLSTHLQTLNSITKPMWLLLFPEGTNLAPSTRASSKRWADKNGIKDMQHTLLPRSTGLRFCLQELHKTTGFMYDCTIAYEGVPRGQYAQDIYTLQAQYVQGKPPKTIHMYWRRFKISDIPVDNEKSFDSWLRARWAEKDAYIEHFYRVGRFPNDTGTTIMPDGKKRKGYGYIETTIKAQQWQEFLQVFVPIGLLSLVLYVFYGQLPKDFTSAVNGLGKKAIIDKVQAVGKELGDMRKTITTYPGGPTLTFNSNKLSPKDAAAFIEKTTRQVTLQKPGALHSVLPQDSSKALTSSLGQKKQPVQKVKPVKKVNAAASTKLKAISAASVTKPKPKPISVASVAKPKPRPATPAIPAKQAKPKPTVPSTPAVRTKPAPKPQPQPQPQPQSKPKLTLNTNVPKKTPATSTLPTPSISRRPSLYSLASNFSRVQTLPSSVGSQAGWETDSISTLNLDARSTISRKSALSRRTSTLSKPTSYVPSVASARGRSVASTARTTPAASRAHSVVSKAGKRMPARSTPLPSRAGSVVGGPTSSVAPRKAGPAKASLNKSVSKAPPAGQKVTRAPTNKVA